MQFVNRSEATGLGVSGVLGAVVFCGILGLIIAWAWPQERKRRVLLFADMLTLAAFCALRATWWFAAARGSAQITVQILDQVCYLLLNLVTIEQCFYWFRAKLDGVLVRNDCVVVSLQVYFSGIAVTSVVVTAIVVGTAAMRKDGAQTHSWFYQLGVYWNAAIAILNSIGFVFFELANVLRSKEHYKCCDFRTAETVIQCFFLGAFGSLEATMVLTQRLKGQGSSAILERVPPEATLTAYCAVYKITAVWCERRARQQEKYIKSTRIQLRGRFAQNRSPTDREVHLVI